MLQQQNVNNFAVINKVELKKEMCYKRGFSYSSHCLQHCKLEEAAISYVEYLISQGLLALCSRHQIRPQIATFFCFWANLEM